MLIGSAAFLEEHGVDAAPLSEQAEAARRGGATVIFVAVDNALAGFLAIADSVKVASAGVIAALRGQGVQIVMLTGDNRVTAEAVARELGIDQVEAEVLPGAKRDVVDRLRKEGRVVAMAGDGVNDAPALAAADVGIAMGTGTDVAMESAGVTLLRGDLTGILRARRLSAATMRNIRQNLFFAFVTTPRASRSRRACSIRSSVCCCRRSSPRRRWRCLLSASSATRSACAPSTLIRPDDRTHRNLKRLGRDERSRRS